MKEIIDTLKKDVYKYYVSHESYDDKPEAYKDIHNVISSKINQVTHKNLPKNCYSFVKELQQAFGDCPINVQFYTNFPNYSITIELFNSQQNNSKTISLLNIRISLLTNHYTVFFEEINHFNGFKTLGEKDIPILFRILSSRNLNADNDNLLITKIKELVFSFFPDYLFVNHALLLNYKISDRIPLGYLDIIPDFYPVYAFLFDNWFDLPTTVIID